MLRWSLATVKKTGFLNNPVSEVSAAKNTKKAVERTKKMNENKEKIIGSYDG